MNVIMKPGDHTHGTKIFAYPDDKTKEALYLWVVNNNINKPMEPWQYHVTVIYSKGKDCSAVPLAEFSHIPAKGKIVGWKVFESAMGRVLAAHVDSPGLTALNKVLKEKYGATSDFPDFIPHITVTWNHEGPAPTTWPDVEIVFDRVSVGPIDPNWKPD